MSFYPRAFASYDNSTSFTPLIRLLDEFDTYSRGSTGSQTRQSELKSFQPRFDVKELPDAYELHGEFPGMEQKDIEVEFTDAQTIAIRGRTERTYTSGKAPALEDSKKAGAITDGNNQSHQPTVEDEEPTTTTLTTAKNGAQIQPKQSEEKFWVSERSVGEFARSFSFPSRVDQDAVTASMKHGILSIVVPKAKKHESRKITIS